MPVFGDEEEDVRLSPEGSPPLSTSHRAKRSPSLSPLKSFDVVLAGDVLYKHCLLEPFIRTVRDMLAPDGRIFLCHIPRAGVTYEIVEQAFEGAGFSFEILNCDTKRWGDGAHVSRGQEAGGEAASGRSEASSYNDAAVGGVELCVDDARRARIYKIRFVD